MLMEHALSGDDCVGPRIENPHVHRIPMYLSALQQNHQYTDPRCASLLFQQHFWGRDHLKPAKAQFRMSCKDVQKSEPMCIASGNVKWCSLYGSLMVSQKLNIEFFM